uniref:Uncharacterized protein n=1 Tax=Rhizophora mucronata TaxID=61149 RepID=A0A2P2KIF9_RHIMU
MTGGSSAIPPHLANSMATNVSCSQPEFLLDSAELVGFRSKYLLFYGDSELKFHSKSQTQRC